MSPKDDDETTSFSVPDSPSPPSSPDPNSNPNPTPFLSAVESFPLSADHLKSKSPPTADPPQQPPLSSALPSPSLNPNPNSSSPSISPNPNSPSTSPTVNPNPNPNQAETLPHHQLQHPFTSTSTSTSTSKHKTLHKDKDKDKAGDKSKQSVPHPVLPVQDQPHQPRSQPTLPPSPLALPEITNLQQIIEHLSGDFDEAKYADMDILDIAKKKGIVFEDPSWWPPGGFPDTI